MSSLADVDYRKWWSPALSRDMELKVYGHAGKPVLVFPSGGGRFFEYEDFGMVEACRELLEQGRVQLFAIDSVDKESWFNGSLSLPDRARRHESYEKYVMNEAVPFIRERNASTSAILTTGCSGGGYHAANFLFRRPDVFDSTIALSGLYGPRFAVGELWDDSLYFHFPLCYLPHLEDPGILALLRRARIILCVGQGDWETCAEYDCLADTKALKAILESKAIGAWVDFWGHDVNHDWPWWRKQMPYFLSHLV